MGNHLASYPETFGDSPQVLIFAEKKADVDDIHEYLLLKGVGAVAIHGDKGERKGPGPCPNRTRGENAGIVTQNSHERDEIQLSGVQYLAA